MRRLFKFRYHKLIALIVLIILAYYIFNNNFIKNHLLNLEGVGYLYVFIAGMLFAFGFTTPFAVGFFITANIQNIYLASLLGGLGALVSDSLIFAFIKFSFMDECQKPWVKDPWHVNDTIIQMVFDQQKIFQIL